MWHGHRSGRSTGRVSCKIIIIIINHHHLCAMYACESSGQTEQWMRKQRPAAASVDLALHGRYVVMTAESVIVSSQRSVYTATTPPCSRVNVP